MLDNNDVGENEDENWKFIENVRPTTKNEILFFFISINTYIYIENFWSENVKIEFNF